MAFLPEMRTDNSFSKDNFQKLITKIEDIYNISFSQDNKTGENYVDYIANMNSSATFLYRQYKESYWDGAVIGIFDMYKYNGDYRDEFLHIVYKEGKLRVNFDEPESSLSNAVADFVIVDSNGEEVYKKNYVKPIDIIEGINVTLSIGTYTINYNPSKTPAPDNIQGKTFAIKDTLIVSKTGFSHESLNFKNAYYTLQLKLKGIQSLESIDISFVENNRGNIWQWNWWNNGAWQQGSIFFNGYDPYSENNQKQFKYIRVRYKEKITYFNNSSQIDYQSYESNKSFMEFEFEPSSGLVRSK